MVSLFTQDQWNTLYPKEDYAKNPEFALHFLLARDQPTETITRFIQVCQQKYPGRLIKPDTTRHGLTPLIIAAMKNKVVEAQCLLDAIKNVSAKRDYINYKDAHNWSCLLHAHVSSKAIFDLVRPYTTQEPVIALADLDAMRSPRVSSFTQAHVFFETDSKTVIPLDDEGIKQIGLQGYRDIPYFPDDTLRILWENTETGPGFLDIATNTFQASRAKPAKLLIAKSSFGDSAHKHPYELRALENIAQGRCISVYTGAARARWANSSPDATFLKNLKQVLAINTYVLDSLDAAHFGNASRMANWGFPNAFPAHIHYKGQGATILLAAEPIKEGSPIVYDYSIGCIELPLFAPAALLNREKMHEHYRDGFDAVLERYYSTTNPDYIKGTKTYCEHYAQLSKLLFPLNFPLGMIDLHICGIVPINKWIKILFPTDTANNQEFIDWNKQFSYEVWVLATIVFFFTRPEYQNDEVRAWIQRKLGTIPLLTLLKVLDTFTKKIQNSSVDTGRIGETLDLLVEELKEYDAACDPDGPLSIHAVAKTKFQVISMKLGDRPTKTALDAEILPCQKVIADCLAEGKSREYQHIAEAEYLINELQKLSLTS